MMSAATGHGLGCDRFGTVRRRFRIASRLLYAACSSLSLRCRLLRFRRSSFGARSRLVSTVRRVYGALRWVLLA